MKKVMVYEDPYDLNGIYLANGLVEVRIESISRQKTIKELKELFK